MGATIDEIIDSLKRGQGKRVSDLVKMALEEGTNQVVLGTGITKVEVIPSGITPTFLLLKFFLISTLY